VYVDNTVIAARIILGTNVSFLFANGGTTAINGLPTLPINLHPIHLTVLGLVIFGYFFPFIAKSFNDSFTCGEDGGGGEGVRER
jgi:hypothetical protein